MFHPSTNANMTDNKENNTTFHVKHLFFGSNKPFWPENVKQYLRNTALHEMLFYIFVFLIPIQTRILYLPEKAYINWYFSYHLGFFFYLTDIIFIALIVSWFLAEKPSFNLKLRINRLILALFALILATLFHVKRIDIGVYQSIKWLELLLLVWYVYSTFHKKHQFHITLFLLYISGVFQAILGILQFYLQHSLNLKLLGEYVAPLGTAGLATIGVAGTKIIRAYGTFPHPNLLGAFLLFSLISGYFLVSRGTRFTKWLVGLGMIVLISGIFYTFSRSIWIAAGISSIVFLGYYLRDFLKTGQSRLTFLILLSAVVVSCGTLVFTYKDLIVSRATENIQESALASRKLFNKNGLTIMSQAPLLGVGVGNYVVVAQDLFDLEPWQYQPAHNVFIFLAAELGVLGAALFAIILIELLKNSWQKKNFLTLTLFFTGIIFILLANFDHYFATIQQGRLTFFLLLGLLAATNNLNHDHASPD
ncbi:MAG: O-antigen ligase family protein [Candidatus Doudnabacteria bacterium]|nr:O-antigen ligase family protein [Candidatus Doudnabacteria bacterium]